MKVNLPLLFIISAIHPISAFAAGAWIEGREAFNTASEQHEFVLRGGYNFDGGAGIMLTNAYRLC